MTFSSIPPDFDEFPTLDDDARSAIDELINGPTAVDAADFGSDYRWSIAGRTEDRLVLFGRGETPETPSWVHAEFGRRAGAWTPIAWGGCAVTVEAPGFGPARLAVDPERPIDPTSTDISIVINEQNCASGRAPDDREIVPLVVETDRSVTITVLVAEVEGGADCPDNPWHPIVVTLESPVGSRQLLDGHEYPLEPIGSLAAPNG